MISRNWLAFIKSMYSACFSIANYFSHVADLHVILDIIYLAVMLIHSDRSLLLVITACLVVIAIMQLAHG